MKATFDQEINGLCIIDEDTGTLYECADMPAKEMEGYEYWTTVDCREFLKQGWVTKVKHYV